jgi:hypothetical protein
MAPAPNRASIISTKTLSAYFSNLDQFMNRLGLMHCFDSVYWRRTLLNQQGKLSLFELTA